MANEFQSLLGELVEKVKPSIYVETGFMTGESTKAVIETMNKIGKGVAYSIEPFLNPTFSDPRLRLIHGYSYEKMVEVFLETGGWDIFLHDSNHNIGCMTFELELAWHFTNVGGFIVCDDYKWGCPEHDAWPDFVKRHGSLERHQLGSCQYIAKSGNAPVKDALWAQTKVEISKQLSDDASCRYGDKPLFKKECE